MQQEKKLVIFCSSASDINPNYNVKAAEFVRGVCAKGYTIVSGGSVRGTMGVVSKVVEEVGGRHIGVIPRFMSSFVYPELSLTEWTDTMAERKEKMREGTAVAVALPGGIGTLDEVIETLTLAKLPKYQGRIFALNIDGFYDKFLALLDHLVETGMLASKDRALISFPRTVEELLAAI